MTTDVLIRVPQRELDALVALLPEEARPAGGVRQLRVTFGDDGPLAIRLSGDGTAPARRAAPVSRAAAEPSRAGGTGDGDSPGGKAAFDAEVAKVASEQGIPRHRAIEQVMRDKPDLYAQATGKHNAQPRRGR